MRKQVMEKRDFTRFQFKADFGRILYTDMTHCCALHFMTGEGMKWAAGRWQGYVLTLAVLYINIHQM